MTPEAAWAELGRAENLRTDAEFSTVFATIWAVQIDEARVADYSTFERAELAGFAPDALIDDDYLRCQNEARRLQEAAFQGVIAPSAALPGAQSLTLFGPRVRSEWGQPALLASSVPCCAVARGSPATAVAERIRHFGAAHPTYMEFIASKDDG
jgi:RES domain